MDLHWTSILSPSSPTRGQSYRLKYLKVLVLRSTNFSATPKQAAVAFFDFPNATIRCQDGGIASSEIDTVRSECEQGAPDILRCCRSGVADGSAVQFFCTGFDEDHVSASAELVKNWAIGCDDFVSAAGHAVTAKGFAFAIRVWQLGAFSRTG